MRGYFWGVGSSVPEMFPSLRNQPGDFVVEGQSDSSTAHNTSDFGDRNVRDLSRHASLRGRGKEELVILATVQRQPKIHFLSQLSIPSTWNRISIDLRTYSAFFANVG